MRIEHDPQWSLTSPKYPARITLPNVKAVFKKKRQDYLDAARIFRRKSRRLFKHVDTEAPLADDFRDRYAIEPPEELFPARNNWGRVPQTRMIHIEDEAMALIMTDGACLDNGKPTARAAAAVVFGPSSPFDDSGVLAFSLKQSDATSNRAELIAVLAAIRCRNWRAEGFSRIVIATDSEHVVLGATKWVRKWQERDWCKADGDPVKNRRLWEELIWSVEASRHYGVEILFWHIDRTLNYRADRAAKEEANHWQL